MGESSHQTDVLLLLVALLIFVPLAEKLRLGSVAAYLGIGIALGPWGFGWISDDHDMRSLADLGVVFLLFSVGLEITIERLRLFGRGVYGLAVAQVLCTTFAIALGCHVLGLSVGASLIIGGALSISSTAVVLQLLSERGQMGSSLGRTAVAIVLMQDLFVPLMILIVNAQSGDAFFPALAMSLATFAAFLAGVFVIERTALRPLLRLAANADAPEVFTAATLLLVLGVGWLAEQLGLTMTLGAFLAGLLVADTEFRHQVGADIEPIRGMLLGLFFASVGLTLDLGYALANAWTVAAIVAGIFVTKGAILAGLGLAFGLPNRRALALGGLLSQGSEFAFVLLSLGLAEGLLPASVAKLVTVAVGLSMMLTPLGAALLRRLVPATDPGRRPLVLGDLQRDLGGLGGHVVIAGFGQVGMAVARHLAGQDVPVAILDMTPKRVARSRSRGLPVFYGNAARLDVLRSARLDHASAFVVSVPEAEAAEQIVTVARQAFPKLSIFARAPDEVWVDRLRRAGADAVVLESLTTALDFAERVMVVHVPEDSRHS